MIHHHPRHMDPQLVSKGDAVTRLMGHGENEGQERSEQERSRQDLLIRSKFPLSESKLAPIVMHKSVAQPRPICTRRRSLPAVLSARCGSGRTTEWVANSQCPRPLPRRTDNSASAPVRGSDTRVARPMSVVISPNSKTASGAGAIVS